MRMLALSIGSGDEDLNGPCFWEIPGTRSQWTLAFIHFCALGPGFISTAGHRCWPTRERFPVSRGGKQTTSRGHLAVWPPVYCLTRTLSSLSSGREEIITFLLICNTWRKPLFYPALPTENWSEERQKQGLAPQIKCCTKAVSCLTPLTQYVSPGAFVTLSPDRITLPITLATKTRAPHGLTGRGAVTPAVRNKWPLRHPKY